MKYLGLITLAGALISCSAGDTAGAASRRAATQAAQEPRAEAMPHETCVSSGEITTQDVNGDGQVDMRTQMSGGRPACRETDANFDGRVDIYRWYDSAGHTTRVEDDYDFDGRIDVVATFQNDAVTSDVLDTNFDGRTDTWRTYQNGHITELRRDANGDGMVDTWERFDAEGAVTYAAIDADHDGNPDVDNPDAGAPETPTAPTPRATNLASPAAIPPAAIPPAASPPTATPPTASPPTAPAITGRQKHGGRPG